MKRTRTILALTLMAFAAIVALGLYANPGWGAAMLETFGASEFTDGTNIAPYHNGLVSIIANDGSTDPSTQDSTAGLSIQNTSRVNNGFGQISFTNGGDAGIDAAAKIAVQVGPSPLTNSSFLFYTQDSSNVNHLAMTIIGGYNQKPIGSFGFDTKIPDEFITLRNDNPDRTVMDVVNATSATNAFAGYYARNDQYYGTMSMGVTSSGYACNTCMVNNVPAGAGYLVSGLSAPGGVWIQANQGAIRLVLGNPNIARGQAVVAQFDDNGTCVRLNGALHRLILSGTTITDGGACY